MICKALNTFLFFFALAQSMPILAKRDNGYLKLDLYYYEQSFLMLQLDVGTPSKNYTFGLDTGSADLWIASPDVGDSSCEFCGRFNTSESTTWKELNVTYNMSYTTADAYGRMGTDDIEIAGKTIKNAQFASIDKTNLYYSAIFGVGPSVNENIYVPQYPNVPARLTSDGIINRNTLSLYAGTKNSTVGGALLFSAIDHAKYEGQLTQLDLVPQVEGATVKSYWANLHEFNIKGSNTTIPLLDNSITVLFDSGSSVNFLPKSIYEYVVYEYFNVTDPNTDTVPCYNPDTITYKLDNGFEIEVPMSDNIFDAGNGNCIIGFLQLSTDDNMHFGIPALQRIYTVFDTENMKLLVAPAVQTDEEDIQVIYKDTDLLKVLGNKKVLFSGSSTVVASTALSSATQASSAGTTTSASSVATAATTTTYTTSAEVLGAASASTTESLAFYGSTTTSPTTQSTETSSKAAATTSDPSRSTGSQEIATSQYSASNHNDWDNYRTIVSTIYLESNQCGEN